MVDVIYHKLNQKVMMVKFIYIYIYSRITSLIFSA